MTAILVILTILVFVGVDAMVLAVRRRTSPGVATVPIVAMPQPRPPQGIFLDGGHGWVRISTDGTLRVGVDDFLTEALGEITTVQAPARGTHVKRGEPLLTLTVKGRTLTVPSPASGEVVAANERVAAQPWLVNNDPYGAGWVVSLWTRDHHEAIRPLRIGSAAVAFMRQELQRLADFLTPSPAMAKVPLLADGGVPLRGSVANLDESRWSGFQQQFLSGEGA
jgi:glycine cleavage system H protein